jgi:hypothetical protein
VQEEGAAVALRVQKDRMKLESQMDNGCFKYRQQLLYAKRR